MSGKDTLLPSDNTVTAYWITRIRTMSSSTTWQRVPMRMASGGRCRNTRKGSSKVRRSARPPWPRRTRMAEFRGNVAHSNYDGFMLLDRNINLEGVFGLAGPSHIAKENPADENSKSVESPSRISPLTRTAMAASEAAASCTSSGI